MIQQLHSKKDDDYGENIVTVNSAMTATAAATTTSATDYIRSLLKSLISQGFHGKSKDINDADDDDDMNNFPVFDFDNNTNPAIKRFWEYSWRLLSSRLTPSPFAQDFLQLSDQITKSVADTQGLQMATRISTLLGRLSQSHGVVFKNPWAIVYFLWMARRPAENENDGNSTIWTASVSESASFLEDFKKPVLASTGARAESASRPVSAVSFVASSKSNLQEKSFAVAQSSALDPIKDSCPSSPFQRYKSLIKDQGFITEDVLVKDILFILQGVNGSFLKFDADFQKILCQGKVAKSCKSLILKLAECGFHYHHIMTFLKETSKRKTMGLYKQSFCFAIQEEIMQYDKFIACLETYLVEKNTKRASTGGLTLIRLFAWLQDQMKKLAFISHLIQVSTGVRGGELLSLLHHYSKHGDPQMQKFMHPIFISTCKAFYLMMSQWMHQGILEDPFDEFFISSAATMTKTKEKKGSNGGVNGGVNGGGNGASGVIYNINSKKIPSFIPRDLAHKIYRTGKSLNFLRSALHDSTWLMEQTWKKNLSSAHDFDQTSRNVEEEYGIISARVIKLMYGEHRLLEHLEAIKKYLLLGQGDFILSLLDHLKSSLDKPAGSLFRHNLTGILETAIRSSGAQYDREDILKRIDVRLMEPSGSDNGWDVFCLEYQIDSPLDAVIDEASSLCYLRLFQYLWKIRRVSYQVINLNWKGLFERQFIMWANSIDSKINSKTDSNSTSTKRTKPHTTSSHKQYVRVAELIHFLNQLQYFMVFEVLECSWKEFVDNLKINDEIGKEVRIEVGNQGEIGKEVRIEVGNQGEIQIDSLHSKISSTNNDIDSIREHHQKYLSSLMTRSLLTDEKIYSQLMDLLDHILKFSQLSAISVSMLEVEKSKNSACSFAALEEDEFTLAQWDIVSRKMREFFEMLQRGSSSNVNLRLLSFRLDFNQFYQQQSQIVQGQGQGQGQG